MPQSRLIDVDLEEQLAALRKELGGLRRAVARQGSSFYEDASETISDYLAGLGERVRPSLVGLRKQARTVEKVAYDHPAVVAGVGLIVVGLVASLLVSRRTPRRPVRSQAVAEDDQVARARAARGQSGRKRARASRASV